MVELPTVMGRQLGRKVQEFGHLKLNIWEGMLERQAKGWRRVEGDGSGLER